MSSVSLGPRVHRSPASPIVVCGQLLALSLLLGLALAIPLLYVHDLARDIFLTLALIFANVWAGSSLWVLTLRRQTRIAEALGVGVASAFIAPSLLLLATPLGLPTLFDWLILPAITIATVAWKSLRSVRTPRLSYSAPSWVGAGIAVLAGIALNRYWLELYRSANLSDPKSFHPDMFALEAIVQANPTHGLGQMGMMADWPMRYHWLSYGWAGSLQDATHATPFFSLAQIMPLLAIVGTALLVAALASRLTNRRWVPAVAALLAICGHQIGDSSGLTINWESPSQAVSTVALLLGLLLLLRDERQRNSPVLCLTVFVTAFVTTGFKFSAGAVLLAGIVGYITVTVGRKKLSRTHLWVIVSGILGVSAFWVVFQSGQETGGLLAFRMIDGSEVLDPGSWIDSASDLKIAAWRTLAVLPGWAGLIFLIAQQRFRMQPIVGAAVLMGCAGLIPLWLFQELAPTSTFFLASAVAGLAAISVYGSADTLTGASGRRTWSMLVMGAIVSVASVCVWAVLAVKFVDSGFILPLLFPVILVAIVGLLALGLSLASFEQSVRFGVATLVVAATLSPVAVLIPERIFKEQLTMSAPRASQPADPAQGTPLPPLLEGGDRTSTLADAHLTGQVVAFADDSLMPDVLIQRIRPYVSWPSWVTLNGPTGTSAEYERRLSLTRDAITGNQDARHQLCTEGVSAIAGKDADSEDFRILSIAQDCEVQRTPG